MTPTIRFQNSTLTIETTAEDLVLLSLPSPQRHAFVWSLGAFLVVSLIAKRAVLQTILTGPSRPINSLLLTDQLVSLVYNVANSSALIWTAWTQLPLAEVFGSKICWCLLQINLFGFVYSIAGGSAIAVYRKALFWTPCLGTIL